MRNEREAACYSSFLLLSCFYPVYPVHPVNFFLFKLSLC
jgi:hypothetical protein